MRELELSQVLERLESHKRIMIGIVQSLPNMSEFEIAIVYISILETECKWIKGKIK